MRPPSEEYEESGGPKNASLHVGTITSIFGEGKMHSRQARFEKGQNDNGQAASEAPAHLFRDGFKQTPLICFSDEKLLCAH